ncbi:FIG022979: MoxR-like ATPases [hydrothermal vent metagenome]|uniref:FIG022979: MoxR-like ATPases n=1 Tax=hydrothermal vent metagenome TaxID=652676 RepID=A0A3B1AQA7_9ZZZZ
MDNRSSTYNQTLLDDIVKNVSQIILGKEKAIRLAVTCLLCRGHILIEDLPGVGKTTLAHALAKSLGLQFNRIQFTSDMLPADILGVSIFESGNHAFHFHPGPIFTQVLLADEVNRATPKTQSALLEAMEEHQVTIEGETRPLPNPFFVIATQNPGFQIGTFPLPESQMDRFLMRVHLGYPDPKAERELLTSRDRRDQLQELESNFDHQELTHLQQAVETVHISEDLLDYVQALIEFSRQPGNYTTGLSPRAGLGLLHAARAWALMHGRNHVLPDDIQAVLHSVVNHRLQAISSADDINADSVSNKLLSVPIP